MKGKVLKQVEVLDSSPDLDILVEAYEKHGKKYISKRLSGDSLFNDYIEKPVVTRMLGEPQLLSSKKVLDIGCGPGIYTKYLLKHGAFVTAVDPSKSMLHSTIEYCGENLSKRATYINNSFEKYDFKKVKFDLILATFMLSYFNNLEMALTKMRLHLKPNGKIIASMLHPFRIFSDKDERKNYKIENYYGSSPYYTNFLDESELIPLKRYTFSALFDAIDKAGLQVIDLEEPRLKTNSSYSDKAKVEFYSKNPSVLVLEIGGKE